MFNCYESRCFLPEAVPHSPTDKCCNSSLKELRQKNLNRPIIAQLNINSIRNKFEFLEKVICDNLDILLISETKLDDSFPSAQFLLDEFSKPYD